MVTTVKISELPDAQIIKALTGAVKYRGQVGDTSREDGAFLSLAVTLGITANSITSGIAIFDGETIKQRDTTDNTGSAYVLDAVNSAYFNLTLTNNCTITVTESIIADQTQYFGAKITQDGSGNHTLAWFGVTSWMGGAAPTMPTAAGASLYLSFIARNGEIIGLASLQSTDSQVLASQTLTIGLVGRTSGAAYSAGYVGEKISSNVAIGSAVSISNGIDKTITSITLTPGLWSIYGNIGFIAASGTLPTRLEGSISVANNTQATSPNEGAYFRNQLVYPASSTQICPVGRIDVNVGVTTSYYLVGTADFSVSTMTGYGSIVAIRK